MSFRVLAGWLISAVCLFVLLLTSFQQKSEEVIIPLTINGNEKGVTTVNYPKNLHAGDISSMKTEVTFFPLGSNHVNETGIYLISHFEIGNLIVDPVGEIRMVVQPGERYLFKWRILSQQETVYRGNLWLFYEETGQDPQLVLGREVTLQSTRFLGLTYPVARGISIFGLVIGIALLISKKITKRIRNSSDRK
jgi:hypothetical protein